MKEWNVLEWVFAEGTRASLLEFRADDNYFNFGGLKMGKRLDCKDLQIECGYSACGITAGEAIQKIGKHIQKGHARGGFSKELYRKAVGALREQRCEQEISPHEVLCEACSGVCLC